jgi:hypothetical protein
VVPALTVAIVLIFIIVLFVLYSEDPKKIALSYRLGAVLFAILAVFILIKFLLRRR